MKPYFGGSRRDASRAYLLNNTSNLTVYSLLSEQSKRDELDGVVMKSVELSETKNNKLNNGNGNGDNDDEDDDFDIRNKSSELENLIFPWKQYDDDYVDKDQNESIRTSGSNPRRYLFLTLYFSNF